MINRERPPYLAVVIVPGLMVVAGLAVGLLQLLGLAS